MEPLVSIITPCYNGEKYIDGYFKSILEQDYSNCQLIFMDDGSTDNTKELVERYRLAIENKGFSFEYHYHNNVGLGATIAEGLTYVKGKYYIWPDIDDFLTKDSIRKKVEFLEKHLDYGIVRTECKVVSEDDLETVIDYPAKRFGTKFKEDLFENCLLFEKFYFQPGCYMIKTEALLAANPSRYIFPSRAGQDIQMLLPVLYKYKCGYIDEPLFIYVKRPSSMSNSIKNEYATQIEKWTAYEEIMVNTIKNTNIGKKAYYESLVISNFAKIKLDVAYEYGNRKAALYFYKIMRRYKRSDVKCWVKSHFAGNKMVKCLVDIRRKIIVKRDF